MQEDADEEEGDENLMAGEEEFVRPRAERKYRQRPDGNGDNRGDDSPCPPIGLRVGVVHAFDLV